MNNVMSAMNWLVKSLRDTKLTFVGVLIALGLISLNFVEKNVALAIDERFLILYLVIVCVCVPPYSIISVKSPSENANHTKRDVINGSVSYKIAELPILNPSQKEISRLAVSMQPRLVNPDRGILPKAQNTIFRNSEILIENVDELIYLSRLSGCRHGLIAVENCSLSAADEFVVPVDPKRAFQRLPLRVKLIGQNEKVRIYLVAFLSIREQLLEVQGIIPSGVKSAPIPSHKRAISKGNSAMYPIDGYTIEDMMRTMEQLH